MASAGYDWRREAFEQLPDAAVVIDATCRIRAANRKACELFESTAGNIEGKQCSELCLCGRGEQHCFVRRMLNGDGPLEEDDMRILGECKKMVYMSVSAVPLRDADGAIIGGIEVMRDVSEIEGMNSDLKRLAETDDLTGLSRRHVLFGSLEREAARYQRHGNPFSVLMMDIDNFKAFNDDFGHQAGDEVLKKVGEILTAEARQEDTVARYGGEEFVSVLVESGMERAMTVAERIVESVRKGTSAVAPDGRASSVSVGVVSCEGEGSSCDPYTMIKLADDALYAAKRAGKNTIRVAGNGGGNG